MGKPSNELVVVSCQIKKICLNSVFFTIANVVAVLLGCTYEEKDLRCPLGKPSNELVVVSCQIKKICLKFCFFTIANVVAVLLG